MAIAWNLCEIQWFKNRKIWQISAIFRFFAFLGNFEFLPWLQIYEMTPETLFIDWLHLDHYILSFIWSQIFQKLQTRICRFRDFRNNFAKNAKIWVRFSQRPKKIFDFSGRFSESSNDELLAVLQAFLTFLTPSMRKI